MSSAGRIRGMLGMRVPTRDSANCPSSRDDAASRYLSRSGRGQRAPVGWSAGTPQNPGELGSCEHPPARVGFSRAPEHPDEQTVDSVLGLAARIGCGTRIGKHRLNLAIRLEVSTCTDVLARISHAVLSGSSDRSKARASG
jgi:hypothetical protein